MFWQMMFMVAEPLSLIVLYIYLLSQSWLRWMDPLIDFPKDLYMAWRVSEGDLPYRDVTTWYGPLPQLTEGAGFHLFGAGLDTIVWMNIVLTVVVVFLLRDIFRMLGNQLSGWLAAVVFLGVFALGNYDHVANYNFIAPYVAQSTYSFAGLVVVLWSLVHHLKSGRKFWLGGAGLGLAVVYLDKPEALLAALGSLGLYFSVQVIHAARLEPPLVDWRVAGCWLGSAISWLAGGFCSLWLPVFLYFLWRGGLRYSVLATNFVPYSVMASRFRHAVETAQLQQGFFGFDQPWVHFTEQSLAGLLLVLVCAVMIGAAWMWPRSSKFSIGWWGWPALVVVTGIVGFWLAEYRESNWRLIGQAMVFPVILAAVAAAIGSLWQAWTGRGGSMRPLGMATVGVAAALMLARMILNGRVFHFGFFMMPLAALWLVHLLVVEGAKFAAAGRRGDFLLPVIFAALVLTGTVSLTRLSLRNYVQKNFQIGEGRDHFFTYAPEVFSNGAFLNSMLETYKQKTPRARTLVVFPEGIAVNYLLRVPTTMAELEFQPVALAYSGPAHILDELSAHPPESIIFYERDYTEFGSPYFGADEASGRNLVLWVNDHYWLVGIYGQTEKTASRHILDILRPRDPGSKGIEFLRDANGSLLPTKNTR